MENAARNVNREIAVLTAPKVPGWPNLPTVAEVEAIAKYFLDVRVIENATPAKALEVMRSNSMVHLACHGETHKSNPLEARVILGPGPGDRLTLGDLAKETFPGGFLAYLSACSTKHSISPADSNSPGSSTSWGLCGGVLTRSLCVLQNAFTSAFG